jgi:hypothetical protein
MKQTGLISTGVLLLFLGAAVPALARQEETKPPKQEQAKPEKQQEAKPEKQQEQAKPEKQQEAKPEKQQEAKSVKQEQQAKAQPQQHAQRTQAEVQRQRAVPALRLSARGTGRIPDARFQASFGVSHTFRIGSPQMVGGYSRFQYSGFWFGFVQPWPVGWYYTDNVYVDYIDGGYYLYNPYYPGARVSISVVI